MTPLDTLTFAHPHVLWLLLLLPLAGAWAWWRGRGGGLRFSDGTSAQAAGGTWATRVRYLPLGLRLAALALMIVALARPQERNVRVERQSEGIDIVLVLDTSSSMLAMDFRPNRFESARRVADEFIAGRTSDRIGLIVFAAQAYTQAPLTLDYAFLRRMLGEVEVGVIEDGTAVGTAVAMATSRLRESEADKVVILLTDGQSNRGEIDPATAAEIAQTMGVRVYAIGVGARGQAPYPFRTPFGGTQQRMVPVEIDEETLTAVAEQTGGRYFRATDAEALRDIYDEIGELETAEVDELAYTDIAERYVLFLLPAALLLLLERLLAATRLRTFP
jgi:Ca-activated chloride channel family protein